MTDSESLATLGGEWQSHVWFGWLIGRVFLFWFGFRLRVSCNLVGPPVSAVVNLSALREQQVGLTPSHFFSPRTTASQLPQLLLCGDRDSPSDLSR